MTDTLVSYRLDGRVATLTMDDGKANAVSPTMLASLNRALDQAEADKAVVVLAGREGRFSAGFDLTVLWSGGPAAADMLTGGFELAARMLAFPRPIVAACTGHALAMGAFLLLACDHRIGADGTYKIGANEVAIGLTMPYAAIELCRQRIGPSYFTRTVIDAEIYTPAGAVAAGFLDQVVPATEVMSAAQATAAALAKLNMTAHAATKLRVRESTLRALRAGIEADAAGFADWARAAPRPAG
ncbi:MAG TPA: crotonase/enoyl-CoA hydratase family protein [Nevskiaceae bacterium]|nr:crotonase/enoyl-CoA hydratase family protein [Nevskiaceae bacterium]